MIALKMEATGFNLKERTEEFRRQLQQITASVKQAETQRKKTRVGEE